MTFVAIVSDLHVALSERGFSRKSTVWNLQSDLFTDVIDIQLGKGSETATVNAGVLSRSVYKIYADEDRPLFVEEVDCTVRTRIGSLIDNRELWWRINEEEAVDDITTKVLSFVLPFLTRMHSLEAMEEFLCTSALNKSGYPLLRIYSAIIKPKRGDVSSACSLIANLRRTAPKAWQSRIYGVGVRIGCY